MIRRAQQIAGPIAPKPLIPTKAAMEKTIKKE